MSSTHLLGPFVRRFLLEHVVADRNLSVNTQRSYRDTIRLLLRYLQTQHGTDRVLSATVRDVDVIASA